MTWSSNIVSNLEERQREYIAEDFASANVRLSEMLLVLGSFL